MNKPLKFVVLLVLLAAAMGGYYYWQYLNGKPAAEPEVVSPGTSPLSPEKEVPPVIYPIPDDPDAPWGGEAPANADGDAATETSQADTLPALDASDPALGEWLAKIAARDKLARFFRPDGMIRRFVVTVDNLPRNRLPTRHVINQPIEGAFLTLGEGDERLLDAANFNRYTPFVRLVEAVDSEALVSLYVRFYPLFQQAYVDLGYPSAYFNDRLVEVMDHLLATPAVQGPIRLKRPRVFFTFANPDLEALSAGQKALLRVGPANAARLKAKIRQVRGVLTSNDA